MGGQELVLPANIVERLASLCGLFRFSEYVPSRASSSR